MVPFLFLKPRTKENVGFERERNDCLCPGSEYGHCGGGGDASCWTSERAALCCCVCVCMKPFS